MVSNIESTWLDDVAGSDMDLVTLNIKILRCQDINLSTEQYVNLSEPMVVLLWALVAKGLSVPIINIASCSYIEKS